MTSPIADAIIRIKNAMAASHMTVIIPFSKFKYELVKVLEKEGYIKKIEKKGAGTKKIIEVAFKKEGSGPKTFEFRMVSKPGRRVYTKAKGIKRVEGGFGREIVSTSKGLMTGQEAKRRKLGGEIICEIL